MSIAQTIETLRPRGAPSPPQRARERLQRILHQDWQDDISARLRVLERDLWHQQEMTRYLQLKLLGETER